MFVIIAISVPLTFFYFVRQPSIPLRKIPGNFKICSNHATGKNNDGPGRNPKTGEEIPISARKVITFCPGYKLKMRVEAYAGSEQ
jgi:hypothetical protein